MYTATIVEIYFIPQKNFTRKTVIVATDVIESSKE